MSKKTILLVEDDYLDVISVQRTLNKLNAEHNLYIAHNGVEALEFLNGSETREKILPDIILLDLNMPKMSGLEFLGIIKNYYSLMNIKIFVMTTSAEEYDVFTAEQLGVSGYIIKPLNFDNTQKGKYSRSVNELKNELRIDQFEFLKVFLGSISEKGLCSSLINSLNKASVLNLN